MSQNAIVTYHRMFEFNVYGLVSILLFYLLILVIGIYAAYRRKDNEGDSEEVMLAGRDIGLFVGIFTMTATWVGGGYINGTAEVLVSNGPHGGLLWCQAPIGYSISLAIGGIFFARQMREQKYVTMIDPLQQKLGIRMGGLLYIPALMGEIFWSAAILSALGTTIDVILGLGDTESIIVSACIAVFYTVFGGMYSVSYTDVVQLFCIFIGLWLTVPFAWVHEAVGPLESREDSDWIGSIESHQSGQWVDFMLLLMFGGIPWQVYFQRVLSAKSAKRAQIFSFIAAIGCIVMAVPAVIIGVLAKSTDWSETSYPGLVNGTLPEKSYKSVLPIVMQYLTPTSVSFVGLGAVSAAVMSSADSSVLSASSMFARNIYRPVFRQKASECEVIWVMRGAIILVAAIATTMAILITSIYDLWFLCSDLVYVILFPQLVAVVHFPKNVNTYGSFLAYITGILLRILGGEAILKVPPIIKYPYFDEVTQTQLFPFRTLAMLISFIVLFLVSWVAKHAFTDNWLSSQWDICECFVEDDTYLMLKRSQAKKRRSVGYPVFNELGSGGHETKAMEALEVETTAEVSMEDNTEMSSMSDPPYAYKMLTRA